MKIIECKAPKNICKVLVGNNCEKPDRVVTEEEGKKMADKFSLAFFEASPKTNQNINEVFNYLVQEILNSEGKKQTPNIELDNGKKKKEKKGCFK